MNHKEIMAVLHAVEEGDLEKARAALPPLSPLLRGDAVITGIWCAEDILDMAEGDDIDVRGVLLDLAENGAGEADLDYVRGVILSV